MFGIVIGAGEDFSIGNARAFVASNLSQTALAIKALVGVKRECRSAGLSYPVLTVVEILHSNELKCQ